MARSLSLTHRWYIPGALINFGLCAMCHQKDPTFFARFHRKTPIFTNASFTQWTPILNKLLIVTERPWHIFDTQRPLIFTFNSQTSDDFWQKIWFFENFDNFDEMLRNFLPFWPWKPLFFDAFHWKTPYFCALCHWKTPFFDAICHRKTPTSEVLGGTRTSLSYASAPLPGVLLLTW